MKKLQYNSSTTTPYYVTPHHQAYSTYVLSKRGHAYLQGYFKKSSSSSPLVTTSCMYVVDTFAIMEKFLIKTQQVKIILLMM